MLMTANAMQAVSTREQFERLEKDIESRDLDPNVTPKAV
jgi:hypothetical protein